MKQGELIPIEKKEIKPDISRQGPPLWIKELRVYPELTPSAKPLCNIKLRPGMNILWAKPAGTDNVKLHQSGISGHSAGKTLFCRLVRYVLGESTFGNDDIRRAIRGKFLEGIVVAEVVVNHVSWLIIRPLSINGKNQVVRNSTIDNLFDVNLKTETFGEFRNHLNLFIRKRLPLKTFPATGEGITFDYILPWLSRDQECRMNHVAQWRDVASDSDAPSPHIATNCHIIRGVLNMYTDEEVEKIAAHKKLNDHKNDFENQKHNRGYYFQRLRNSLPRDIFGSDFQIGEQQVERNIVEAIEKYQDLHRQAMDELNKPEEHNEFVAAALKNWQDVKSDIILKESEIKEQKSFLARDLAELRVLTKKPRKGKKASWAERQKTAAPGRCNTPLDLAIANGCILAQEHSPDYESCSNLLKGIQTKIDKYEESIRVTRDYIKGLNRQLKDLLKKEENDKKTYESVSKLANKGKNKIAEKMSKYIIALNRLNELLSAYSRKEKTQKTLSKVEARIKDSLKDQGEIRKKNAEKTNLLNSIFKKVLQDVLEPEMETDIIVEQERIRLESTYHGPVSSTGVKAIKIIAFDYAALCMSLEEQNGHPGFLMHDSPREADMGADIYQRFFIFMKEQLEDKYPEGSVPGFQYIVTTTEPPPKTFQKAPWLINPVLDASTAEGRLLSVDL
jgi:hypothetical protein